MGQLETGFGNTEFVFFAGKTGPAMEVRRKLIIGFAVRLVGSIHAGNRGFHDGKTGGGFPSRFDRVNGIGNRAILPHPRPSLISIQKRNVVSKSLEIYYVRKTEWPGNDRVVAVGGVVDKYRWSHSEEKAVSFIECGIFSYYITTQDGGRLDVIVGQTLSGEKYLKTVADAEHPDSLLNLPKWPEPVKV